MLFVIDTVTTGPRPGQDVLWELACVGVRQGRICGEWSSLVRLESWQRTEAHRHILRESCGLGEDEIALLCEAPPARRVRAALVDWMCAQAGAVYRPDLDDWKSEAVGVVSLRVTSYHTAFDRAFLEQMPWSLEYFVPALAKVRLEWADCLMLQASEALGRAGAVPASPRGGYRWPKLHVACTHFGVPCEPKQRALPDARAAGELAIRLGPGRE